MNNVMILGNNATYDLDCYKTKRNNNVLVVGGSGTGKTRSIVIPNILQATGSYVISDPKGNLFYQYAPYLILKGYKVKHIDFIHPERSDTYNPFAYIKSPQDIKKLSHILMGNLGTVQDPFWDYTSEILVNAAISFIWEETYPDDLNLRNVCRFIEASHKKDDGTISQAEALIKAVGKMNFDSFAVREFNKVYYAPEKTWESILVTAEGKLGTMDLPEVSKMMEGKSIDFKAIGKEKTAVFVSVSDTDRSLDNLANAFFSQAMNELCEYADNECHDNKLPIDVRFFLDDFGTNVAIAEFPRMISSIRSRGISAVIMIQAESQLSHIYSSDGQTIISNCDTYVYLGGNDIDTAKSVATRGNVVLDKVLNMPVGKSWIFRRGEKPIYGDIYEPPAIIIKKENELDIA